MGTECCQSVHEVHETDDQLVSSSQCDSDVVLMGGGIGFEADVACTDLEWYEAPEPTDEPELTGCCYRYGHGAMMVPCCQSVHEVHETDDQLVGASECNIDTVLMDGGIGFEQGVACTEMEWYETP